MEVDPKSDEQMLVFQLYEFLWLVGQDRGGDESVVRDCSTILSHEGDVMSLEIVTGFLKYKYSRVPYNKSIKASSLIDAVLVVDKMVSAAIEKMEKEYSDQFSTRSKLSVVSGGHPKSGERCSERQALNFRIIDGFLGKSTLPEVHEYDMSFMDEPD